ncbi:MAG: hypothetical protein LBC17_01360 [Lactobacillaceae bacterium]|jgi:type I restriction enzyme M protein|nr:hypothetical protein [Lactobacillaceae bacterium]
MHVILGILTFKYLDDKNKIALKKLEDDGLTETDLDGNQLFDVYETFKFNNKCD